MLRNLARICSEVISSEKIIYSKKHKYAGIMDAEAIIKRKLCVIQQSNVPKSELGVL
jgi:hypothetical protein